MKRFVIATALLVPAVGAVALAGEKRESAPRSERFEKRFDTNTDGLVSRDEFVSGGRGFDRADRNASGVVTRDEIDAIGRPRPRRLARHLFAKADADRDGQVTRGEANALRGARFDVLDRNRDGNLTRDEAREDREGRRARRREASRVAAPDGV